MSKLSLDNIKSFVNNARRQSETDQKISHISPENNRNESTFDDDRASDSVVDNQKLDPFNLSDKQKTQIALMS